MPSSGGERARGGGAAAPRARSRTNRGVNARSLRSTQRPRWGIPEGGAPSPVSRLTASQSWEQPRLTKPKKSSGYGARGTREGKRWLRKNDSVGFGDVSPLRRSPVCLVVCKVMTC